MSFWIYILKCADNSYYTGQTDNLERRIAQHEGGAIESCYTFSRRPLNLVFSQEFPTREEALASERQIKGWSRKKKEAMIRGDWAEVSRLAKSVRPELVEGCGSVHPEPLSVRPEPLSVRPEPLSVRPELVEGCGSTSSPRTDLNQQQTKGEYL
jgi:predicted GIY-YIG superfamily endonuclease